MHGKSPQNDKQKAQMKLSFHNVSATKTKRESVSLENQNVTELCQGSSVPRSRENKEHLKRLQYSTDKLYIFGFLVHTDLKVANIM